MIYAASLAVAVGEELGLSVPEIERGVALYEPAGSRMRVHRLSGDRRLLDDCYNANPQSMSAALRVLAASEGKKIAVLGDMKELGELTESAHRAMASCALCSASTASSLSASTPAASRTPRTRAPNGIPTRRARSMRRELRSRRAASCCARRRTPCT